jgi:hypothetical protein
LSSQAGGVRPPGGLQNLVEGHNERLDLPLEEWSREVISEAIARCIREFYDQAAFCRDFAAWRVPETEMLSGPQSKHKPVCFIVNDSRTKPGSVAETFAEWCTVAAAIDGPIKADKSMWERAFRANSG